MLCMYVVCMLVATLSSVFSMNSGCNRCSGMKGRLRFVPDCKCKKCTGDIRQLVGLSAESESLEVVNKFDYLGDMISAAGGVEESIVPLDVVGRYLGNFCLYLPQRCFHCEQKVKISRYV